MKRAALLYIFLCLLVGELLAQQAMPYRYHIFDDYLLNPAYVGTNNYYPVLFAQDQAFVGLNDASPQLSLLSLHSRVGRGYLFEKDGNINKFFGKFGSIALGFQMAQYFYGPNRETNIGMTYGYHFRLNQNYKRKLPRKAVLAVTPRIQRVGYNASRLYLVNEPLDGSLGVFSDAALGNLDDIRTWVFTTDVGGLYQSVHADVGLTAMNIVQTRNKLESENLNINDSISIVTTDSLYPTKFVLNGKLKFLDMYNSPKLDIRFVPTVAAIYAPKTKGMEFFIDARFQGLFKEKIAGIRSNVFMDVQMGVNVQHFRNYNPATMLKPYFAIDFQNYVLAYVHHIYLDNDLVNLGASWGGSQIAIMFKLGNERTERNPRASNTWYR